MNKNSKSALQRMLTPQVLAEAGIVIAIMVALELLKVFRMPYGGSVKLLGYMPLFLLSMRRGPIIGAVAGFAAGLLNYAIEPYGATFLSILLDYPLPYFFLGLAGVARSKQTMEGRLTLSAVASMIVCTIPSFFSHVISGAIFFQEGLGKQFPGVNYWIGSMIYNSGYVWVNAILGIILFALVWKPTLSVGMLKEKQAFLA